ncbi:MAG: RHS repeat-associated core domain-containing protein, partial [Candidatus Acidiferrum sp.]
PDRLLLQSLAYSKGATSLFSTNYWYKTDSTNCPNSPAGNNGQIQCITDNVDSGRTVNYSYDAANRPATAVDSANGITYAAAQSSPPSGCLTTGVCYTPQGSEYSAAIGKTGTFNGINLSETFNNRLQPLEIKASSSAGNAFDISFSFVDPTSQGNAGHVYSITNNLNSSRSQSFTYDHLNRIVTAGTTATTGTYCWGYQYNYDAWGNLLAQAGWSPNYNGCSEATMGSVTADVNNHISGFTYDLSGNTQNDGSIAYTYDAESQVKTAAGLTYFYDGSGQRISKSNGKLYWFGRGGILAETNAAGTTLNEYIFFGGKRVAILPAGGNPEYYAEDFLGSSRVMIQSNGTVCYDADYDPYGGEHPYTNNCSSTNAYKFEGKERDTETGNDDFGARYYTNRFGRWLSADWSSVPVPVPYANLTNPQTLNLYSMVSDDPETFADLDGHCTHLQSLCNLFKWGHWVDNAHLDAALQRDADLARANIAKTQNMTFNDQSPKDFAKNLNNQQAILAQRALDEFLASQAITNLNKILSPCAGTEMKCGIVLPIDFATSDTVNWSATATSEGEARAFARTKLGQDPIEVEPGKLRSKDGRWQYRAKPGDVSDNHIHLEQLDPTTGAVIQNLHIRWPAGTSR